MAAIAASHERDLQNIAISHLIQPHHFTPVLLLLYSVKHHWRVTHPRQVRFICAGFCSFCCCFI